MARSEPSRFVQDRSVLVLAVGASICSGCAHLGSSIMPFQIDALMTGLHQSASLAGLFGFFEIFAFAMFMLLLSRIFLALPVMYSALSGMVLGIVACLLVYVGPGAEVWICSVAVLLGLSAALLGRSYVRAVSSSLNPERIYAIASGGGLVIIVSVIALVPVTTRYFGSLGVFLAVACIMLLAMPSVLSFRNVHAGGKVFRKQESGPLLTGGAIALLCVWVGCSLGSSMAWSFAERMGRNLGLSPDFIVSLSTVGIVTSVLASLVGAAFAHCWSRETVLLLTLLGTGAGCLLTCVAWDAFSYGFGVVLYWNCAMLSYAWLLGSAATLDGSGRVGTFCGGMDRMGYALGAPLGGLLVDHTSFAVLGICGFLMCVLPLPFALPVLFRALHQSTLASGEHEAHLEMV
ncbi:hypothetical protein [Acetobacter sp.]|jgi:hypothetical protein|uniref:hypothetical protein n=1 Tax=Acetobacter sp. TaxID=440 RepID=UPI0025C6170C|nr:hypothetical protein [Acetobacter sp.]MCH4089781.1 hypothetical protein [Acetobacter sp.]MCI1298477.1 hypothetical protein [Acetobacter sp.]